MKKITLLLFLLCSCGYKESYIAYTQAVPKLPAQPTIQVSIDKTTGNQIISYTDPRDKLNIEPPNLTLKFFLTTLFILILESSTVLSIKAKAIVS